jgi:decaprenyl-phosphate phosphoribosyltransferase
MQNIFLLIRPWQWTKNLFIFLPLFFALQMHQPLMLVKAGLAFIVFCLLASSVYILNDYFDRETDKLDPRKKMRPLAAGKISVRTALMLAAFLLAVGLFGSWLLNIALFYLALFYITLNIAYTIKLKHIAIVDIFIIAAGFVIRIFVGGVVTGVKIYPWIVIMTFLLAMFLALGKRRDDVVIFLMNGESSRKSIDGYNLTFIDGSMMVMASVTIVSYIMYTMSHEIITKFKTDHLYLTTVFVILGIMRYLQIAMVAKRSGDASEILFKDYFIQLSVIGWIITFGFLIYW